MLEMLLLDLLLDVSLSMLLTHGRLRRSFARSLLPRTLRRPVTLETQPAAVTALGLDLIALLLPLLAHDASRLDATYARLGSVGRIEVVRASTRGSSGRATIGRAPRAAWQAQTGASRAGQVSIAGLLDLGAAMADGAAFGRHGGGSWGGSDVALACLAVRVLRQGRWWFAEGPTQPAGRLST